MPIPSSINDLSTTAGSNSPSGSESPSTIDDYLRVYASYIALLRDQKLALAGGTMTGALNDAATQTIASATTTDIGAATSNVIIISGTTTITALGTIAAGARRSLRFTSTLVLTHNATSLVLPGSANIITLPGDVAEMRSLGGGNWVCTSYTYASGMYSRTNSVGTVSQSGGTVTGAIIETGSNASGTYTKFADGTMICRRSVIYSAIPITTATGGIFYSSGGIPGSSFAATFIANPNVVINVSPSSGLVWHAVFGNATTTTGPAIYAMSSTSSTVDVAVVQIAYGRWF
ncbi:hypothetical protein [Pseudomonas sp. NFX98]|uniref:hypothetical protein n=1 Tax=Pseudomonas sp. NFX98 TaxID=3399122 RepID=UPI0039FD3FDE